MNPVIKELFRNLVLPVFLCVTMTLRQVDAYRAFVTPGRVACYVSLSKYEYVTNSSHLCTNVIYDPDRASCGGGYEFYMYCSMEHECCYHNGCHACCTQRNTLNGEEVAAIVVSCITIAAIAVVVTYFICGRFCKIKAAA